MNKLAYTKIIEYLKTNYNGFTAVVVNNSNMDKTPIEYIIPTLQIGKSTRNSNLGSNKREERIGILIFSILLKEGNTDQRAYEIADKLDGIFRNQTLTLQSSTPSPTPPGLPQNGANQFTQLIQGQINFSDSDGPRAIGKEGNRYRFSHSLTFRLQGVFGVA